MIQFKSIEETLVLVSAIIVAAIAYKLFKASVLTTVLIATLTAGGVGYVTYSEFTLRDGIVGYRGPFRQVSFPLAWIENVQMDTFVAGLPGHTFMFRMNSPPASVNGYFMRTGFVSWPSARRWIAAVDDAIRFNAGLHGTFRLVRATRRRIDTGDTDVIPMEDGLVTYGSGGVLFMHVGNLPSWSSHDDVPAMLAKFDAMKAYSGKYYFASDRIQHQISLPADTPWIALSQIESFKREDKRLILSTPSPADSGTFVVLELEELPDLVILPVSER